MFASIKQRLASITKKQEENHELASELKKEQQQVLDLIRELKQQKQQAPNTLMLVSSKP